MAKRKKTWADVFSYTTIGISMAMMSGLALGHITEKSMQPRFSADPPSDPVERFGLGQNAYDTTNAKIGATYGKGPEYAETSYEMGRYVNGARILVPYEPARKSERVRLERLQAWDDESFDPAADLDDERFDYAEQDFADYQRIDVGAIEAAPEPAAQHAILNAPVDDNLAEPDNMALDMLADEEAGGDDFWAYAED